MERRAVGRSDLLVSSLGLGGNNFGRFCDERQTEAVVKQAVECGVTLFDTADTYNEGRSEEFLGKALRGHRDEVILSTKTGWSPTELLPAAREVVNDVAPGFFVGPDGDVVPSVLAGGRRYSVGLREHSPRLRKRQIIESLEASLRRLQTDHVDIYYFHFPDPKSPIEESLEAMDDLVRAGKVRYAGCSNYQSWQLAEMMCLGDRRGFAQMTASQNCYSMLDRAIEQEVIPACLNFGVGLVAYFALAGGFLTGKYRRGEPPPPSTRGHGNEWWQRKWLNSGYFDALERYEAFAGEHGRTVGELALAWLLARPAVCSVIAGATRPEQVVANVRAAEWRLSPEEAATL